MILALASRFGSQEVALISLHPINENRTIFIPSYLTGLAKWVAITRSVSEYEKWRDLISKLSQGESVDFDLGWSEVGIDGSSPRLRRWFISPLPEAYHKVLAPVIEDWFKPTS